MKYGTYCIKHDDDERKELDPQVLPINILIRPLCPHQHSILSRERQIARIKVSNIHSTIFIFNIRVIILHFY